MADTNMLLDATTSLRGKMQTYYSPMGLATLDEKTILRAVKWWDNLASIDQAIQDHTSELSRFCQGHDKVS